MPIPVQFEQLTTQQRRSIVDQALVLFEDLYVHLPLKHAMHAVRPIQRLRLLRMRLGEFDSNLDTDFEFHNEMTEIFNSVRDLHMNYLLPKPFSDWIAFLPFQVEAYWNGEERKYIVTNLIAGFTHDTFKAGVEILYWSGVPIARAVEIAAQMHAGSNLPARHARGVVGLTIRPLLRSLPPDAEWVDVRYRTDDGEEKELRLEWQHFEIPEEEDDAEGSGVALENAAAVGLDLEGDVVRRATKRLYAPNVEAAEKERRAEMFPFPKPPLLVTRADDSGWPDRGWPRRGWPERDRPRRRRPDRERPDRERPNTGWLHGSCPEDGQPKIDWVFSGEVPASDGKAALRGSLQKGEVETRMPKVFDARAVNTESGNFAYIRIRTFNVDNGWQFVFEFVRLAALLPQEGLIIDVRDNGGGLIMAGELMLQTLTPRKIEPERLQFVNTPLTRALIERHSDPDRPEPDFDLTPWLESAQNATRTGATYSRGFPITSPMAANILGQQYHGPVVLITNARCYSTTDIFAAGFKDHAIGEIIGTDANTGAGGANVWRHDVLQELFKGMKPQPIKPLPQGVGMRVSARRTIRVGADAGTPLEDLGVAPDTPHDMTRRDLMEKNIDLIEHAGRVLAAKPLYRLQIVSGSMDNGQIVLEADLLGLDRLDLYVDDRPVDSIDVSDGTREVRIDLPAQEDQVIVDFKGLEDGQLRAARRLFV